MPRKYLRISRRRTCVTLALQEEENDSQRFILNRCIFLFVSKVLYFDLPAEVCRKIADQRDT